MSELLRNGGAPVTLGDLKTLQRDVYMHSAVALRDAMTAHIDDARLADGGRRVAALLRAWDGNYDADSAGALAFEQVATRLAEARIEAARLGAYATAGRLFDFLAQDLRAAPPGTVVPALNAALDAAAPAVERFGRWGERGLSDRAADFEERKNGIDQGISNVQVALDAVNGIDELVTQLKGLAISAKSATGTELTAIVTQYNSLITQADNLALDAEYQGLNLVNGTGSTLKVEFGKTTGSTLTIASVDLRSATTGLDITSAANFSLTTVVDDAITELDAATVTLRSNATTLGSNVGLLQTRLDFTNEYVDDLKAGADKLTLADVNAEGASLVALQTRQQLGITALAFAAKSEAAVLLLFR